MSHAKPNHSLPSPHYAMTGAQRALDRALQLSSIARMERLIALTGEYPNHGPTWLALAEEHAAAGRNEEAVGALRRSLRLDLSLRSDISTHLATLGAKIIAEAVELRSREEAAARAQKEQQAQAASHIGPADRIVPGSDDSAATRDLAAAMRLPLATRRPRLAELALVHPAHGATWLALAEDHLSEHRAEYAVSAYDRALHIDPTLHTLASQKLEALHRYHRKVRLDLSGKVEHSAAPAPNWSRVSAVARPSGKPVRHTGRVARGTTPPPTAIGESPVVVPPPAMPAEPGAHLAGGSGMSEHNLHLGLVQALDISGPQARLDALEALEREAPNSPSVLFHLALELALIGRAKSARMVGDRLMRLSPQHYQRLYEVAERHWPSVNSSPAETPNAAAEPTRILTLPEATPAAATAQPMVPELGMRTQVLPAMLQPSPHLLALASTSRPAADALSLPLPSLAPERASVRAIGFLAAGVLFGVILVILVNWLLPKGHASDLHHPRAETAVAANAVTAPAVPNPTPNPTSAAPSAQR